MKIRNKQDSQYNDKNICEIKSDIKTLTHDVAAIKDDVHDMKQLLNNRVIARSMEEYKIKNCLRLSIGNSSENKYLVNLVRKIFKKSSVDEINPHCEFYTPKNAENLFRKIGANLTKGCRSVFKSYEAVIYWPESFR